MMNNIKLTITTFVVTITTEIPILIVASTGIAKGNFLVSCCMAYVFIMAGSFAFRMIKRIRDKFNW